MASPSKRSTIVLVEDERTLCRLLEYRLQKDYVVVSSHNGTQALTLIRDVVPDLVVSGLKMPGLNGWELHAQLQDDERTMNINFIMYTAAASTENRNRALQMGMDSFVSKGEHLDVLWRSIETALLK